MQLIRDVVTVSEATNWSTKSSVQAKYKTLNCEIEALDPEDSEYDDVFHRILSSETGLVTFIVRSANDITNVNITRKRLGVKGHSNKKTVNISKNNVPICS